MKNLKTHIKLKTTTRMEQLMHDKKISKLIQNTWYAKMNINLPNKPKQP